MIKAVLDNEILQQIVDIEKNKSILEITNIPINLSNRFRKNTKKMSSYASNKIEGNPTPYEHVESIVHGKTKHLLKPEQEIKNYYDALEFLEKELSNKTKVSLDLILEVQKRIVAGESKEKVGLRGQMPPGFLFAVYDSVTREAEYIPPEYVDVEPLLNELINYLNTTNDHPLIQVAILHYQLVTIHPFEDGNGRTARIMSNYLLEYYGYGFKNIGSLEEYFSYDIDDYYNSIQMGLPALYYKGRNNPPHPEIWLKYFLKVFSIYANKVVSIAKKSIKEQKNEGYDLLSSKAKKFLEYLKDNDIKKIIPVEIAQDMGVSNRTIINWCVELANQGYLKPNIVNKRIRSYTVI